MRNPTLKFPLPRWFVVWWSLFLSRCWFLSLAVVLLEFSGKVGRRHWKAAVKRPAAKGRAPVKRPAWQGEGAAFGRTQAAPSGKPTPPLRSLSLQAGGALGGGRGGQVEQARPTGSLDPVPGVSQLARWEMKKCTPLWREANFEVKMYKTHHARTTFGSWDV
jgi:hypothetical protein